MLKSVVSRIKISCVNHFPFLSVISRFSRAVYYNSIGTKESYSQHGEDKYILEVLITTFPNENYKYIDVGAFHPMLLSNTYLFYRNNYTGATVEPNKELNYLHKNFRSNDIHLQLACSRENRISKFYLQKTFPALSSLANIENHKQILCDYVPVFNLDTIYNSLDINDIHFLSIDAEGSDFEVLEGGNLTLSKTFIVCIECNNELTEKRVHSFLKARNFTLLKRFSCNLVFKNEKFNPTGI